MYRYGGFYGFCAVGGRCQRQTLGAASLTCDDSSADGRCTGSEKNLLVNETVDAKFVKSAGNIAGVKTTFAGSVNTYDVLNADKLIISVDAAKKLEEVLG